VAGKVKESPGMDEKRQISLVSGCQFTTVLLFEQVFCTVEVL
jgi:hypothetical protein